MIQLYAPFQEAYDKVVDEQEKPTLQFFYITRFIEGLIRQSFSLVMMELSASSVGGFPNHTRYQKLFRGTSTSRILTLSQQLLQDLDSPEIARLECLTGKRFVDSFDENDIADCFDLFKIRNPLYHPSHWGDIQKKELVFARNLVDRLVSKNRVLSASLKLEPIGGPFWKDSRYEFGLSRVILAYGNHEGRPLSSGVFHVQSYSKSGLAVLNTLRGDSTKVTFDLIGRYRGMYRTSCYIKNPSEVFKDLPREWLPIHTSQKGYQECKLRNLQPEPLELDQDMGQRFMGRDAASKFVSDFLLTSPSGILLIEADLGTGKSWLLRRTFQESQSIADNYGIPACCAYFYSKKTEGQEFKAIEMLKHLLAQVILQLKLSDIMINEPNYIILVKRIIKEIKGRYSNRPPVVMLFVDALDEIMDERERLAFASILKRISSDAVGLVKLVVSCRRGNMPLDELQPDVILPSHLLEDRDEIEQYAQTMLSTDSSLSADEVNSLSTAIADKAFTNYLYAHHLVQLVQEGSIETVEEVECLPPELFNFFRIDLEKKIATKSGDFQFDMARADILPVLSLLRLFKKPLPIKYIAEFTAGSAGQLANDTLSLLAEYLSVYRSHIESPYNRGDGVKGSVSVEASVGLRVAGHLEFLEDYEPITNILGDLTVEVVRHTASTTDPLSIELLARSWLDLYKQLRDDHELFRLSKNRGFIESFVDRFSGKLDSVDHPIYRWVVKEESYRRTEDYVQAVVRYALHRRENRILEHIKEERYWSAWFSRRPKSLQGLSSIRSQSWPYYVFSGDVDPCLVLNEVETKKVMGILPLSTFDLDAGNGRSPLGWKNYQIDKWGLLASLKTMINLHGDSDLVREHIDLARDVLFENLDARPEDLHWAASWLNNWWLNLFSFLGRVQTLRRRDPSGWLAEELFKLIDWWGKGKHPVHTVALTMYSPQLQCVMSYLGEDDKQKVEERLVSVWSHLGENLGDYYKQQEEILLKKFDQDYVAEEFLGELEGFYEDEDGYESVHQTIKELGRLVGKSGVDDRLEELLGELPGNRHEIQIPYAIYMSGFAFRVDEIIIPNYLDERDGTSYADDGYDCEYLDFKEFPWMIPMRVMEILKSSNANAPLYNAMKVVLGDLKKQAKASLIQILAFRIAFESFDTYWDYIEGLGEYERRFLFVSGFEGDSETIWGVNRGVMKSALHNEPENIDALCRIIIRKIESDSEDTDVDSLIIARASSQYGVDQSADDNYGTLDVKQQFIVVNTILEEYCLSNEQLELLLQCYPLTADRFRKMAAIHFDPQCDSDLACFWTYFKVFLQRNIWDKELLSSGVLDSSDESYLKGRSKEVYLWVEEIKELEWPTHSPYAHIDMTFGWLFLMQHCSDKVPTALKIIREGIDEASKWASTGLEFLDSFVVAVGFLEPALSKQYSQLYTEMFPEFVVDTNIPDCIESYNYIYELDNDGIVKFLDAYYESSQGAVRGGDLLRDTESTKKSIDLLLRRKKSGDFTIQELLDSVESQLN